MSPRLPDGGCSVTPWLRLVVCSLYLFSVSRKCATPPHVYPTYVQGPCMLRVLPVLPPILVLQVTNSGVRRPGYEARYALTTLFRPIGHVTSFHIISHNTYPIIWDDSTVNASLVLRPESRRLGPENEAMSTHNSEVDQTSLPKVSLYSDPRIE